MLAWLGAYFSTCAAQETKKTERGNNDISEQQKFQQEIDHWELHATNGDSDAQFNVGALYSNNQFAEPDYVKAIYWYTLAAEQDNARAQYNLGHHYLNGIGTNKDIGTAMQWWLAAAEQDHALAQFNIGRAYYLGIGLPQDNNNARYWFERAADNDEEKSIALLKQIKWDETRNSTTNSYAQSPTKQITANDSLSEPKQQSSQVSLVVESTSKETPIRLFTDPDISQHAIMLEADATKVNIIEVSEPWTTVTHAEGFPVWVHRNFIKESGSQAVITADDVNARTEPYIIHGNIVGRLKLGETISIIKSSPKWYQVIAPTHFKAWVKTAKLDFVNDVSNLNNSEAEQPNDQAKNEQTISQDHQVKNPTQTQDNNQWLFEQNPDYFTLQLASLNNSKDIDLFLTSTGLKDNDEVYQFTSKKQDVIWTYFLYGAYSQKNLAKQIKNDLGVNNTWVRRFESIQQKRCVTWKKQLPPPEELNKYCTPS